MKKMLYGFASTLLIVACDKKEGDKYPAITTYSLELVDKNSKSIFDNKSYNQDTVYFFVKSNNGFEKYNPEFKKIDKRIVSRGFNQIGVMSSKGNNILFTTYIYLSKSDTDTLELIQAPYSFRSVGSDPAELPTYMAFYYNGKLMSEYDFVEHPELLEPFYRPDLGGQIITLRKN